MQDQDLRWLSASTAAPRPRRRRTVGSGLRFLRRRLRYPVWPLLLAAVLLLVLLVGFHRVVARGVIDGAQRRSAAAAEADDLWRCRLISRADQRRACLAKRAGG